MKWDIDPPPRGSTVHTSTAQLAIEVTDHHFIRQQRRVVWLRLEIHFSWEGMGIFATLYRKLAFIVALAHENHHFRDAGSIASNEYGNDGRLDLQHNQKDLPEVKTQAWKDANVSDSPLIDHGQEHYRHERFGSFSTESRRQISRPGQK